jgi:hypothetical protein
LAETGQVVQQRIHQRLRVAGAAALAAGLGGAGSVVLARRNA